MDDSKLPTAEERAAKIREARARALGAVTRFSQWLTDWFLDQITNQIKEAVEAGDPGTEVTLDCEDFKTYAIECQHDDRLTIQWSTDFDRFIEDNKLKNHIVSNLVASLQAEEAKGKKGYTFRAMQGIVGVAVSWK